MRERTFDERASRYLDGEFSAGEHAEFEAELRDSPELARAVADVRTIEAGLRDLFSEPSDIEVPATAPDAPGRRAPWLPWAAAAALLIATLGVLYLASPATPQRIASSDRFIYQIVTRSFEPEVVCDTPEKFLEYTTATLGEPLEADFARAADVGINLLGWRVMGGAYDPDDPRDHPRVLLARGPDGTPVVVYFREPGQPTPYADPTNPVGMHARDLGRVTAYEISPLDGPVVLDLLSRAD